jgi:serine/threonine protein kinase
MFTGNQYRGCKEIARALLHAAIGLAGIHERGGFHRDIKPENLLVVRRGEAPVIKLGDFGLARVPTLSSGPVTRTAMGTWAYMAPELQGGAVFDARCDIFSLGLTGVELLVGERHPGLLSLRADIPPPLRALLTAMTSPAPENRPTLTACRRVLRAVLAPPPAAVVEPSRLAPPAKPPQTPAQAAGGWGPLALFLGSVVALATMNNRDGNGRWHGRDGRFRSGPWG